MSTPAPPPPPPAPPAPVPGQATSLLDVGGEALALRHGLEALIRTLNKQEKVEFQQHLRGLAPSKGQTQAYINVYAALVRASQG